VKAKEKKKERGNRQLSALSAATSQQPWRQANAAALAGLNRITPVRG